MKRAFVILSVIIGFGINLYAQMPEKDGVFVYESVVTVEGADQETLYKRALMWFTKTYNSANNVLQMKDEKEGSLIGKGLFKINYYTRNPSINHTLSIFVKDGRFKYILTDLKYSDNQGESFALEKFPKSWAGKKKLYETVNSEILVLLKDLEVAMSKNTEAQSDDW